ncbi:hypothetical protein Hamer_G014183 [Homarus americanus]|uniref:Uncharacterized protein n=1 Tax=Homarus americanus TaxID=6706 RepID=A0A8J5MSE3_HOMAM|nr:hypothetical protein Hamer_G014183 [Homarus americanus]
MTAVCVGRPDSLEEDVGLFSSDVLQPRAVPNPKTPNQILDAIAEGAVKEIIKMGWGESKRARTGFSEIPFKVNNNSNSLEKFEISKAKIRGLASLTRSRSASFNDDQTQLKGTLMVENVCITANYCIIFAGVEEAPSQTFNGEVTECVEKLFADLEVGLLELVPQNIQNYIVRSGHDSLDKMTNLDGNKMAKVHIAGVRKSLRQELERTMNSNMKVMINRAINAMKKAATEA